MAGQRVANVLIAYNNFPAARSVPLLEEAVSLGVSAQRDGSVAAGAALAALSRLASDWMQRVGSSASPSVGAFEEALGGVLGGATSTIAQLAEYAKRFEAGSAQAEAASEFRPSPEETEAIVREGYSVRRNFLLQFSDDDLDQSTQLRALLRRKFANDPDGIGGRTEIRETAGTHITPNLPNLRGMDWTAMDVIGLSGTEPGGARELADRLSFEQEVAAALIAAYIRSQVKRLSASAASAA